MHMKKGMPRPDIEFVIKQSRSMMYPRRSGDFELIPDSSELLLFDSFSSNQLISCSINNDLNKIHNVFSKNEILILKRNFKVFLCLLEQQNYKLNIKKLIFFEKK